MDLCGGTKDLGTCRERGEKHAIRCCSDTGSRGVAVWRSRDSNNAQFTTPDGISYTAECDGTGAGSRRSQPVTDNVCPELATYDEAFAECAAQPGYHLCTAADFQTHSLCGSGWGCDALPVGTSAPCSPPSAPPHPPPPDAPPPSLPPMQPCYDNGVYEYSLYPPEHAPQYHVPVTAIMSDVGGLVAGSLPTGATKQECYDYINMVGTFGDLRDLIVAALWSTSGQSDFCGNHQDLTQTPVVGNC